MLHVTELQRRLDEEGVPILVLTTHPGTINSDGVKKWIESLGSGPVASFVRYMINLFFTMPTHGAYSTVFAAAAPEVRAEPRKFRGSYITPPTKHSQLTPKARDPETSKDLWELTERVLKDVGVTV